QIDWVPTLAIVAGLGDDLGAFAMIFLRADLIMNVGVGQLIEPLAFGAAELERCAGGRFLNLRGDVFSLAHFRLSLMLLASLVASGDGAFTIQAISFLLRHRFDSFFFGAPLFAFALLVLD